MTIHKDHITLNDNKPPYENMGTSAILNKSIYTEKYNKMLS